MVTGPTESSLSRIASGMALMLGIVQGAVFAAQAAFVGFCLFAQAPLAGKKTQIIQRLDRCAVGAGILATVGLIPLFALRAQAMLDEPLAVICTADGPLIAGTRAGHAIEAAFVLSILALAAYRWRKVRLFAAFLGIASLASRLATSHVVAEEASLPTSAANAIHVLLAALWFGSLPPLLVIGWEAGKDAGLRFAETIARFSKLAFPSMLAILGTGFWLATDTVASWPRLFGTVYGLGLLVKLLCVVGVLAPAYILRRRLRQWGALDLSAGASPVHVLEVEFIFAAAVVLMAAVISQTIPAEHDVVIWPFPFRVAPIVAIATNLNAGWLAAAGGAAVVTAIVLSAIAWRRGRLLPAAMAAAGALAAAAAIVLPAISVPAYPTTYVVPAVPYDAHVIARGSVIYDQNCAICHGKAGHADGPAAAGMKPAPADLTQPHTTYHTMGDMFWWVSRGYQGTAMPGFESALSIEDRWAVVSYVMALSLGYQARVIGPEIAPRQPWLHAIDFPVLVGRQSAAPFLAATTGKARLLAIVSSCGNSAEAARKTLAQEHAAFEENRLALAIIELGRCAIGDGQTFVLSALDSGDLTSEIATAWALYRRSFLNADDTDSANLPEVTEFLIDRFGFVRARWRSDENPELVKIKDLLHAVRQLQAEPEINRRSVHDH